MGRVRPGGAVVPHVDFIRQADRLAIVVAGSVEVARRLADEANCEESLHAVDEWLIDVLSN